MSEDLILSIDQGTTGTTCLLANAQLEILGVSNVPFPQHYPKPGLVEHRPDDIWKSVLDAIEKVLASTGVSPKSIAAIGIANQRETILVWDRVTRDPIYNAIVWQDGRTEAICNRMKTKRMEPMITQQTGLLLDPYFSATKLGWILDNVKGGRARAQMGNLSAGTVDSYLLWKLTGGTVHATDPSNACRTLLWPLDGDSWSSELCDIFDIPEVILPNVFPSNGSFGVTCGVPGLPDGIPITGIIGDQQSALFAQACFEKGEAKCTYGTGAFVMLNTGRDMVFSSNRLLTTIGWKIDSRTTYCLEGSAFMAGAVVEWLVDGMGIIQSPKEVESLAKTVSSSDGVVFVPAHVGLGAPHWRPEARGLISGLTRGTTKAHIARAALEGIALQVADLVDAMEGDTGEIIDVLKVDGGAAANDLLLQTQADLIDVTIVRPNTLETTALGAVFMAGLGVGMWSDLTELKEAWKAQKEFEPADDIAYADELKRLWKEAVDFA